ncbi:hypothetical protein [Legionella qingyii]|nr:hypothetical protein [Legionella qingyii]
MKMLIIWMEVIVPTFPPIQSYASVYPEKFKIGETLGMTYSQSYKKIHKK